MIKKICHWCKRECFLYYSNPKTCSNHSCKQKYNEEKKKSGPSPRKGNNPTKQFSVKIGSKTINKTSDKQLKKLAEYRPLRDKYLREHPYCEIQAPGCTNVTTELHHKKPRRFHLCDVEVFCASCRNCNDFVEREHEWARQNGFKIDHL